jgi:hypothetical protein
MTTHATSRDGTAIALDRTGDGPAVVIVGGALVDRSSNAPLAALLSERFTVLNYDRRGRGASGDAPPHAVEREVEDLEAIVDEAGGSAFAFGTSSGGNLVLAAARRGVPITKLALWEPNFVVDDSRTPLPPDYVDHLGELVASGRRGDAVAYFLTAATGMPEDFVAPMREMPMWPGMEAGAHTLAYDGAVVGDSMSGKPLSADDWNAVSAETLVLDGGTTPWLSGGAQAIAAALPHATHRTLAGQTHDVAPDVLAPALVEFFEEG